MHLIMKRQHRPSGPLMFEHRCMHFRFKEGISVSPKDQSKGGRAISYRRYTYLLPDPVGSIFWKDFPPLTGVIILPIRRMH